MKKIISLFQRNYETDHLVRNEVVPGAEWVIAGEGVATRKFDGTCCLIRDGKLYKRYEVKMRRPQAPAGITAWVPEKPPLAGYEPATDIDPVTLKQQGWVPVGDGPEDKYHREALSAIPPDALTTIKAATFELLGPKIQGNPEGFERHTLLNHRNYERVRLQDDPPRDFDGIRDYLRSHDIEGIVWHHPDGRMVKIKAKDFGIKRKATSGTAGA